jgi:hypothetical protein
MCEEQPGIEKAAGDLAPGGPAVPKSAVCDQLRVICGSADFAASPRAVEADPGDGRLWAGLARICAMNCETELLPWLEITNGETVHYAEKAVHLCGEDQHAWCVLAWAHTIAGDLQAGHEGVLTALARNPNSVFFRDTIGYLLILQGEWERGARLSSEAVRMNPLVRDNVFIGLWLDAFRREAYEEALAWAHRYLNPSVFWAPLMRASARAGLGEHRQARQAVRELWQLRPDFASSGHRLIRKLVKFEGLAQRIEQALPEAGMMLQRDDRPAA